MRIGRDRMQAAAAGQDRRDACGRTKRPSGIPARTASAARLIEFSTGTSSSICAAVPRAHLRPHASKSRLTRFSETKRMAITNWLGSIASLFRQFTAVFTLKPAKHSAYGRGWVPNAAPCREVHPASGPAAGRKVAVNRAINRSRRDDPPFMTIASVMLQNCILARTTILTATIATTTVR